MELLNNNNNHHVDESIDHYSSNEEEDQEQESKNNNSLGGRWYECVFCKRGFNTAQALGGHMNIHRKDRANKNNPTPSSPMADHHHHHHRLTYTGPRVYQPIFNDGYDSSPPPLVLSSNLGGNQVGHHMNFINNSYNNNYNNHGEGLYPYVGDDWSMKLRLQLGSTTRGMLQDFHMEKIGESSRDQKELDLELRLGPHP